MHKLNARQFSFLFIISIGIFFTSCEDKGSSQHTIPVENTTEVLSQTIDNTEANKRFNVTKSTASPKRTVTLSDTFTLSDIHNKTYNVRIKNKQVYFKENSKKIVLMTFFASWCPPCIHDIPYMNDLYKKYSKEMLLTGILIHDSLPKEKFRSFLNLHQVKYYVSNSMHNNDIASLVAKTLQLPKDFSIPLTVMYVNGEYFTHYEGCVPVEMIEYDIQQALKMLK